MWKFSPRAGSSADIILLSPRIPPISLIEVVQRTNGVSTSRLIIHLLHYSIFLLLFAHFVSHLPHFVCHLPHFELIFDQSQLLFQPI